MRVMTIPDSFHWTNYDDTVTLDNVDEYLKTNELNIRRCIGEAVPTQIMKNVAYKIKMALDDETTEQVAFFNSIKDLVVAGESIKIKAEDYKTLNEYLPQVAGLLADKTKVEIHCYDFSNDEMAATRKLVQKWDWADFIKICPEDKRKPSTSSYQLILANGRLSAKAETQLRLF